MADNLDINTVHKELAKKDFIVFAGTGILGNTGIPSSWKKLLEALFIESGIVTDIENIPKEKYPDKAEDIYKKLVERKQKTRYIDIIREQVVAKDSAWSEKAFEILLTSKDIVTTNFDKVFEASYNRLAEANRRLPRNPKTESLPDFKLERHSRTHKIVYLHGCADEHYTIFKRSDYETYYPSVTNNLKGDNCLETYLEYIYSKHTIVFVGFSFDDVYLRNCLKIIKQRLIERDARCYDKLGRSEVVPNIRHYAFMQKLDRKAKEYNIRKRIENELEDMQIKIIHLEKWRDWMDCFERVRNLRQRITKISGKTKKRSDAKPIL